MEEPIQNAPVGAREVLMKQEHIALEQQQVPDERNENYIVAHEAALQVDTTEQVVAYDQQQQLLIIVDNYAQQHVVADTLQYSDTSHLYRCNATREDLLNSGHLSQTRCMSIYDLCPLCLDLGQLVQVGHHNSALVYIQPHVSISYEQLPEHYREGQIVSQGAKSEEGQVVEGVADLSAQMGYAYGDTGVNNGANIDTGGHYQYHTDYQSASYLYHTQYQANTVHDPHQQEQEPIYYATLPEGAQFGQIYVDQDGNQIIFQPAPQYEVSDVHYEQYQVQDPNQQIQHQPEDMLCNKDLQQ